jgi:exosortase A
VFSFLLLGVVALTWPTWVGLAGVWDRQFGYSHGFLVAPISAWLAWRALNREADRPVVPAPVILAPVALTSSLWLFARLASVRTLEQLAAIVLLWTAATAVMGWRWGRILLFPLGYLLFAVPVWEALVPVLQPMTTVAAGALCDLIGIPTHLDGNIVHIPNGSFAISEGCAGNHYFVASVTLAALYGHLEYSRWRSSVLLIGLAGVLAIVCNWLRVVLVIHAGYTTGMRHPWVEDHNMVGWVLFAAALIPLSFAARRLGRDSDSHSPPPRDAASAPQAAEPAWVVAVFLAALVATALPQGAERMLARNRDASALTSTVTPPTVPGWDGPLAPDVDWTPTFRSADAQLRAAYEHGGVRVTLFNAAYVAQEEGKEVIGYDNRIEGDDGWILAGDATVDIPQLGRWRRGLLLSPDERRRVAIYRYTVAGRSTALSLEAKLWQGLSGILGDRSASILVVSTACRESCDGADAALAQFLTDMSVFSGLTGHP